MEAGVLEPIRDASPARVEVLSLASAKQALDLVRQHADDRHLLAHVLRVLRDRADLATATVDEGTDDLTAGRTVPLTDDLLRELAEEPEGKPSTST